MSSKSQSVLTAALVGAMSPEADITLPPRARSSSFASTVADLNVGDQPAARVWQVPANLSIETALTNLTQFGEKLRNSVQSSVSQAKRRIKGAEYSIEITDIKIKSGIYLLVLVHRTA